MLPMQANPKWPRRVIAERDTYWKSSNGRFDVQYTDRSGRAQRVAGGIPTARPARFAEQGREGSDRTLTGTSATFGDVGEEWLGLQTHLRPRTHDLYRT